ncbi:hypothetical protein MRX96_016635 [Rhipicephalus microplus]
MQEVMVYSVVGFDSVCPLHRCRPDTVRIENGSERKFELGLTHPELGEVETGVPGTDDCPACGSGCWVAGGRGFCGGRKPGVLIVAGCSPRFGKTS